MGCRWISWRQLWEYQGNIRGISWEYYGNTMGILWATHWDTMEISWEDRMQWDKQVNNGNRMGKRFGDKNQIGRADS